MQTKKELALINFKKTKSLLEKLIQMAEKDGYCVDIMQQNMAAIGLLKSAHQLLMENHLNSCFKNAFNTKNEAKQEQMIKEILTVTKLANK